MLPPPGTLLGLSDAFPSWYAGQDQAALRILDWLREGPKFLCAQLPTGSGKSILAALACSLSGKRTVVLTATKGLQDQFQRDFEQIGFRDVRGQNAYPCLLAAGSDRTVDEGICHIGVSCPHKVPDWGHDWCEYYAAVGRAASSQLTVTNYAYWLAQASHGNPLGERGLVVMDEADEAFGSLESYLKIELTIREFEQLGLPFPTERALPSTWEGWQEWAHEALPMAQDMEERLKRIAEEFLGASLEKQREMGTSSTQLVNLTQTVQRLIPKLESLRGGLGQWVWDTMHTDQTGAYRGVVFTPVWPGRYARLVYGEADRVLVMSATLTPKTADLLGIREEDRTWLEMPSSYPPARTPIQQIRTVRVDHRATDVDMRTWVTRIDQLIERRLDRKGLVLPVSYQRARFFQQHSRHGDILITHDRRSTQDAVDRWRRATPPAVLVSPSVTRGWDFPGDDCRYIVIGKVPFPDGRDPVIKARGESDPDFAGFETMQTIVQEAGRGTRSPDDWCEVFIMDDHFGWFVGRNKRHAPRFFLDRLKYRTDVVPDPISY